MKIDVSKLKKGDRLCNDSDVRGFEGWWPFVEVLGPGKNEDTVEVLFSNGKTSPAFSPNGWCQFKLMTPKKKVLENK